jgi:meso-butanediol dehydrogenase/(S,S)-butanediol dehydrogenase/diacetyl reductase
MKRFEGKAVLVTGAASGIGRSTAQRFAVEGAGVTCADVNEGGAEETAVMIRTAGGEAIAKGCDVSDLGSVKSTVAATVSRFGRLDAVANVAGIGFFRRTTEVTLEDWNRTIGVNLTGTFLVCQQSLPHILESKGSIVNVASVAGLKSHPYAAAYCASKGGVVLLTRALAEEYARKEIRINCVCPGGVETPFVGNFRLPEGAKPAVLNRILPLSRMGRPEEIAAAIAFLASNDASFIHGAILPVDGGMAV